MLAASRAFYQTFKVEPEGARRRLLYSLGDGQWDTPDNYKKSISAYVVRRSPGASARSEGIDHIEDSSYLSKLCGCLTYSMVEEGQHIAVKMLSDPI